MMFLFAIAATISFSIANPLAAVLSSRQIVPNFQCVDPSITLPARCSDALNDFIRMANITNNFRPTPENLSRLARLLQSELGVLCSSECQDPFIRCAGNTEQVRMLTTQINCVRAEDGNYCPVKLLQAQAKRPRAVLIPPDCAVVTTTCSSSCQQTYRQLRDDLGCCTATIFTHPLLLVHRFERNFATCGVSLGNPCSGAAIICRSLVLVLAMVLLSFAIVLSMQ